MTEEDGKTVNRRTFIKNSSMVAGGIVGGTVLGGLLTNQWIDKKETPTKDAKLPIDEARVFFSRKKDFDVLSAATERIFPEDELGPGAVALGVPYFIDRQLASAWGTNAKEYMRDPFWQDDRARDYEHKDTPQNKSGPNTSTKAPTRTPRYQTRMNRGEMMLEGVRTIDKVSMEKFSDSFTKLEEEDQNAVLTMFENGEIDMEGVAAVTFFNLLVQLTLEGAYADPAYGGNKDMMGWKMKEYPGPRMAYIDDIEAEEFIVMEQKSLRDYQG
ncbi:MAG TPA: gluconate 2-dehydrogenase subunit 3 family protein [Candidatus Pseudogracilibacillus intestinigallinarum]|uniref:Gluconate 2-dehydrogenase subunit 3 family protein n=1 Tax=Candidatus Pseudogracilibacillus intestinigallinarum TaxID=2838742 RepID=A0A9D1PKD2_9BACI|nr:gluconate 2-dehydrogenase subunit 3 family protein [Candidatus Pseudogracilibacillus intestinigallinarum]